MGDKKIHQKSRFEPVKNSRLHEEESYRQTNAAMLVRNYLRGLLACSCRINQIPSGDGWQCYECWVASVGIKKMVRVNILFSLALKVELSNIFTGTVPSLGISEEYASQQLLQWLGFVLKHK